MADRFADFLAERDREALAELPPSPLGTALWPSARLDALRMCVELIITWAQTTGQNQQAEGMSLINLATAGSIPQALVLKVWQQQTGQAESGG